MVFSTQVQKGVYYKHVSLILSEAFRRLGYRFQLESYPSKRALKNSNSGAVDGEALRVAGIEKTYTNLIRVPEALLTGEGYAYSTKEIEIPNGWEDLRGHRVAAIRGLWAFKKAARYAAQFYEVDSQTSLLRFLLKGRADIILDGPAIDRFLVKEEFRTKGIRKLKPALTSLPFYAYLNCKHEALVIPLAKTLQEMKLDGTYASIMK
ncbi:transporter substrate-binding domain-containing protein [Maridesulfovibrio sp.]|uniref:substrate-binding periplasmic protein n=1 Tax=Maridesulfovibrio sp. TaxID=2795000 RepID=UPI002A18DD8A|nr:transporter substrate-binding domain-containing protein [Maridesulfovibrio sp.]